MKPLDFFKERAIRLRKLAENAGLDAFLVTSQTNVSYLSGFLGHDSLVLITRRRKYFITDSRYLEDARNTLHGFDIKLIKTSAYDALKELVDLDKIRRVGFEANDLSYGVAVQLKKKIRAAGGDLLPTIKMVESLRAIKDEFEIAAIKRSIKLTKTVMRDVMESVRPGLTEESLARRIEKEFIDNGAKPGFDPIVASGANSSRPHARASSRKISKNSFIMIDIGCMLGSYNSDITRMAILGSAPKKFKTIYNIVHTAQQMALEQIRPGASISAVDFAARGYIHKKGFGKYFGHALGHGVGMAVHEDPSISRFNNAFLKEGMVITIEPAIYLPGFGGVRIEDMVLVTDKGYENLTRRN